jgi:hypothetical protein
MLIIFNGTKDSLAGVPRQLVVLDGRFGRRPEVDLMKQFWPKIYG